jgi:hypothetical protein
VVASDRIGSLIGLAKKFEEIYDGRRNSRELHHPSQNFFLTKALPHCCDSVIDLRSFHRERRSKRLYLLLDIGH